jgi:hypothetical protein
MEISIKYKIFGNARTCIIMRPHQWPLWSAHLQREYEQERHFRLLMVPMVEREEKKELEVKVPVREHVPEKMAEIAAISAVDVCALLAESEIHRRATLQAMGL